MSHPPTPPPNNRVWLVAGLLAGLLIVHLPPFLCMPPDNDVVLWDICSKTVLGGGVLYRDVFENNLPGMLWWQASIRATLGWRSETLRLADAVVVGLCIWLLVRGLPETASPTNRLALAVVLAAFYLSTSEWCHAQRDVWMLLPVLLALGCRVRQVDSGKEIRLSLSLLEGLLWGVAVWIKPFILVTALTCWLASAVLLVRRGGWRWLLVDAAGLLVGGLLAGGAGLGWLAASGAWTDFWDIQLVWNREYTRFDYTEGQPWLAFAGLGIRFFPWALVHLAALPLAVEWLSQLFRQERNRGAERRVLLAALYLGWLGQVVILQHHWDYLHVAPLFLALTILGVEAVQGTPGRRIVLTTFLAVCVLFRLLPLTIDRLPLYLRCWREGSTPELRDRLGMLRKVDWQELERVRQFLKQNDVRDGELSVLTMGCMSFYLDPGVRPATRYIVLQNVLVVFASQRQRILAELAESGQRYLVVDEKFALWKGKEPPPPDERIVFKAGRYRVYAVAGHEMAAWTEKHLDFP